MGTKKGRRRKWYFVLLSATFLGVLTMVLTGGCADRVLLYPSTYAISAPDATRRLISGDNGVLETWVQPTVAARNSETAPEAFVLHFCGNGTRAEEAAEAEAYNWREHPVAIWAVNYPGYGGSTGPARLRAIPPAALTAYDEIASVANGRPIYVSGNSLGTAAALYVAANRPAAGMVLRNPPPLRYMIMHEYGWWNLWILSGIVAAGVPQELNSINNATSVDVPAVFLMCDSDRVVPPKYQRLVLGAYAGEKRAITVEGADHNDFIDGSAKGELLEAIRWLRAKELPSAQTSAQSRPVLSAPGAKH